MITNRWWSGPRFAGYDWIKRTVQDTQGSTIDWELPVKDDGLVVPQDNIRHFSNLLRLRLLYEAGGLWLDCDVIPLRHLATDYPYTASLRGRREGAVMWFPTPRHPWLRQALDGIQGDGTGRSADVSGAHYLDSLPDMGVEREDLFSHDRLGRLTSSMRTPWAVHMWLTSSTR